MDDTLLALYIAEVGQSIKTYLNRSDIPPALSFVYANMVIDFINGEQRKDDPEGQAAVSSIKEGDVTVQFGSVKADSRELATQALMFNYSDQLNRHRKFRW
ncbi:hypothetical protein ACFQ38_00350 [Sporosarcina contaminans]|uniref:Phage gp6-like head-tail connector protein n=1 Tax=Sporosarcina contaminans TaxID=633403 RepID=A0ABW3TSX3_9BACL